MWATCRCGSFLELKKADSAQQLDINGDSTIGNNGFRRAMGDWISNNGVHLWRKATIITTKIASRTYRSLGMPEHQRWFSAIVCLVLNWYLTKPNFVGASNQRHFHKLTLEFMFGRYVVSYFVFLLSWYDRLAFSLVLYVVCVPTWYL